MVQYWRALMKHDISISARVTKWFMSCDVPLYGILKPRLPGTNTCSAHVCSSSNCRLDQHIASLPSSLPPQSWQTWKGLPGLGTMVTDAPCIQWQLRWVFGAEEYSLNLRLIPSPSLMERFFILLSLKNPSPIHSVAWPHYPAKVFFSSKMAVNHDDGVYCSLSPDTEREDVAFMELCFFFFGVYVFLCVVLQRNVLWALYTCSWSE